MRSTIARNGALLANGVQRACQSSRGGRRTASRIIRDFHQDARRLAQPPNNRPDQSPTSIERSEEERRRVGDVRTEEEQRTEREEEDMESTKAEAEARKPLLRKTLRQRRQAVDAPPTPPPIPEWFLKYNVKLRHVLEATGKVGALQCVDRETGHVLFTVPTVPPLRDPRACKDTADKKRDAAANPGTQLPSDQGRSPPQAPSQPEGQSPTPDQEQDEEDVERFTSETLRGKYNSAITGADGKGFNEDRQSQESGNPASVEQTAAAENIDAEDRASRDMALSMRALADQSLNPTSKARDEESVVAQIEAAIAHTERALLKRMKKVQADAVRDDAALGTMLTGHLHPAERDDSIALSRLLRWVLLEAEMGLRAGMTVAADLQQASSFAASRVDISLVCPDPESHEQMDHLAQMLAAFTGSDLVRLDANDFAELSAEYVGRDADTRGSFSMLAHEVFEHYEAVRGRDGEMVEKREEEEEEEEEIDEDDEDADRPSGDFSPVPTPGAGDRIRKAFREQPDLIGKLLGKVSVTGITLAMDSKLSSARSMGLRNSTSSTSDVTWDDARLTTLLESILDAPRQKRAAAEQQSDSFLDPLGRLLPKAATQPQGALGTTLKAQFAALRTWPTEINMAMYRHLSHIVSPLARIGSPLQEDSRPGDVAVGAASWKLARGDIAIKRIISDKAEASSEPESKKPRTIIQLRDLKDVWNRPLGVAIVRRLVRIVRKRRQAGEEIILLGTSAIPGPVGANETRASEIMQWFADEEKDAELPFRQILVPPMRRNGMIDTSKKVSSSQPRDADAAYRRIYEINMRHIESMCRRLRPAESLDLFTPSAQRLLSRNMSRSLSESVLTQDGVQRIVLMAIGLAQRYAISNEVNAMHIGLASLLIERAGETMQNWAMSVQLRQGDTAKSVNADDASPADKARARVAELRKECNSYEAKLLPGVVDPANIKVGFKEVHATPETIDSLKTLTSLALLRPDAFKYGILAQDRLTGLMLYGPPGTGKTLLAKAVAKECSAVVLEVSGAQIYEKYVGEGEKMVRAVFSLAKKLAPCIVFIDEADAIFGSRNSAGNRNTHREIINQFLREWDGVNANDIFVMVATNRPFDLDDAVLRRLPRRILVDLPVAKDREAILKIHLRDEQLGETVSLADLAEQTPFYSGSDLKNLCVAAALACVREESALAETSNDSGEKYSIPDKRTLNKTHFDQAFKEISASISEDMSTLTAIRKFDEQYGDGRGKKKKAEYGFGLGAVTVDENAVRVRPPAP